MVRYNAEFTWFGVVNFLVLKGDDESEQNIFSLFFTQIKLCKNQAMTLMCHHLYIIIAKNISAETDLSGDSFITPTKHYWLRVFGAPITYVIPVA